MKFTRDRILAGLSAKIDFIPCDGVECIDTNEIKEAVRLFRTCVFNGYFCTDPLPVNLDAFIKILYHMLPSQAVADEFIARIPELRRLLATDVKAVFDGDPAAVDYQEVIISYPAITAMTHYRFAHALLKLGVQVIPRAITELAHSATGIDIHPGAEIGEYFSIDHGTGVVIGETSIIGNHVRLYQGVTLGARSFKFDESGNPMRLPRHPILEDNVVVYSNSSILGRIRIGHDSIIGGNVWQTQDLPPYSRVVQGKPQVSYFSDGSGI